MWLIEVAGFLYFGYYGDPVANFNAGNLFPSTGWFQACAICVIARFLTGIIILLSLLLRVFNKSKLFLGILAVAIFGLLLQIYQYYLQLNSLDASFCNTGVSCGKIDVIYAGFITIPLLAWVAFLIVSILAYLWYRARKYN